MSRCSQDAVRIQAEDFSQEEEIRALRASSHGIGGIVSFLGCARDFSEGREVSQISFDAYERMLLPELHKLRDEALARFELIDELKERLPIWKKETTPQGDSWVTPHA